jgi:hypothetical protein
MSSHALSFVPASVRHAGTKAVISSACPVEQVAALFDMPFNDPLFRVWQVQRKRFNSGVHA